MKSDRSHGHKKHKKHGSVSDHSIFVQNTVTVEAPKENTVTHEEKQEDGCTNCFKALFSALKR